MAEDDEDRTYIFSDDVVEERTTEFQPPAEIKELQQRLAAAVKKSSAPKRPSLPDGPTLPKVDLHELEEDEVTFEAPRELYVDDATLLVDETTGERATPSRRPAPLPLPTKGVAPAQPAAEEATHVAPRPKPPVRPPTGRNPVARPSEEPTHVGEAPSRPPSGRYPSAQQPAAPPPSPPKPRKPSGRDVTVILDAEDELSYNKGLVPRTNWKPENQQVSGDLLAEAGDLARLNPADQTIIGYAANVSGFHDLEMLGRNVQLKRPRRLVLSMGLMLGLAMSGALTVTLLQAWTTPERIALLAGSGMFLSAALTALVGASVWKKAARGTMFGAFTGAVCSLGCAAVAFAWAQEDMRANLVRGWEGYSQTLRDALDDESDVVRAAACRKILERGDSEGRRLLLPALTVSPAAAADCLGGVESPMAIELAGLIAQRWSKELVADMEATDGPERVRAINAALPALPLDRSEVDLRLLHCTFNASKDVARNECATTLGATFKNDDQWGSRLTRVAELGTLDGASARGVIAMALGSTSLSAPHQKLAKQADATALGNQWGALAVASEVIARGETEPVPELVAGLEKNCSLDVLRLPQSRESWFNVSNAALARRGKGEKVLDSLCNAAIEAFAGDAFENAQALVAASIRQSGKQKARDIDAGWLMINAGRAQTYSDLRSMVPEGTSEEEAQKIMRVYGTGHEGEAHPLFLGNP